MVSSVVVDADDNFSIGGSSESEFTICSFACFIGDGFELSVTISISLVLFFGGRQTADDLRQTLLLDYL